MCFLSCSLDSPPALTVPVLGTLSAASGGHRKVCARCSAPPPPAAPGSSPFTLLPLQTSALMGNTDPLPPPFPMAFVPTSVSWDLALWENLPLAPEKSFRWEMPAETWCILAPRSPSWLCLLPLSHRFPERMLSSSPRRRQLREEGISPDARGGTSVVQGTGSYLSADSTVITL